jgi:excisionase family DNA binding protein
MQDALLTPAQVTERLQAPTKVRISIPEIARRLGVCRDTVYGMLDAGQLPGIRIGRRWLVTRPAYEAWEKTCGARPAAPAFRTEVLA